MLIVILILLTPSINWAAESQEYNEVAIGSGIEPEQLSQPIQETNDMSSSAPTYIQRIEDNSSFTNSGLITTAKNIFQIIFFITVSVIAVLTYSKAKKTLLQPIKTEIFKLQLELLTELLGLFSGKHEGDLRRDFGFKTIYDANVCRMLDQYLSLFYAIEADEECRPYSTKVCPVAMVLKSGVDEFRLCDDHMIQEQKEKPPEPDSSTKAILWSKYKYGVMSLPAEYMETQAEFKKITDSPLLPKKCLELVKDYLQTVNKNIEILGDVLTECAQEMPEKYPNLDTLKKSNNDWIYARYNHRFICLEEKAMNITRFLRNYFSSDNLFE